jgi:hypothetical protein
MVPQSWTRLKRPVCKYIPPGGGTYDAMSVTYFPEQGQYLIHQAERSFDLPWFRSKVELTEFLTHALAQLERFQEDPGPVIPELAHTTLSFFGLAGPPVGGDGDGSEAVDSRTDFLQAR